MAMDMKKHILKRVEDLLEEISQHSEGSCPFCGSEDYPVKGSKKGYNDVSVDEAEEWNLDHHDDCFVTHLESLCERLKASVQ